MGDLIWLVLGLVLVVVGAEVVVRSGSTLAAKLGISPLVVGMTVVSLGTSLPELAVGISAAHQGTADLAVGNIVGTNLVNLLLILGLAAALRPVVFELRTLRVDLPVMLGAGVLLLLLSVDHRLSLADGLVLCAYGAVYLALLVRSARRSADLPLPADAPTSDSPPTTRSWLLGLGLVAGIAVTILGAEVLVSGAVGIATRVGLSDAVIGLTVVAIGTSVPELVTTVVSTIRGERSLAIGNLLGSSVFNIALVLGLTVVISPGAVAVPDEVVAGDLGLLVVAGLICVPVFWSHRRLGRLEGALFVLAYVVYLVWVVTART